MRSYMGRLQANPLQTKMWTAAVFMSLGEVLAGNLSGMTAAQSKLRRSQVRAASHGDRSSSGIQDFLRSIGFSERAGKMFLYGFLINAPLGHVLTGHLQRAFAGRTSFRAKVAQIAVANLTISVLANVINLLCMGYINGVRTYQGLIQTVKANFWKVMRIAWTTNPISIAIAQNYLPLELWGTFAPHHRHLTTNPCSEPFFMFTRFVVGVWINTVTKKK